MKDVLITNPELLKKKIEQIKKDGISHFHVVSDFDRTLTPAFINGKKPSTSFAKIREGGYLGDEYFQKAQALFYKYRPMETSIELSLKEKKRSMLEWWEAHLGLMVEYGLKKSAIDNAIKKKEIEFRKGVKEFMDELALNKIPMLIFSAGLGDVIKDFLISENAFHDNMHLISNLFKFDSNGKATGYNRPVIHTFNKDEGQIKKSSYYEQIKYRKNVLLIGDALGDCDMLNGLEHKTIIKIAFLNENVDELKDIFSKNFDVLILNDGTFDYVNRLLKEIMQ